MQVRCVDTGQIILLNLSAQKNASATPLDVVIAKPSSNALSVSDISNYGNNDDDGETSLPGMKNNSIFFSTAAPRSRFRLINLGLL